jgi:hypothetical protein
MESIPYFRDCKITEDSMVDEILNSAKFRKIGVGNKILVTRKSS